MPRWAHRSSLKAPSRIPSPAPRVGSIAEGPRPGRPGRRPPTRRGDRPLWETDWEVIGGYAKRQDPRSACRGFPGRTSCNPPDPGNREGRRRRRGLLLGRGRGRGTVARHRHDTVRPEREGRARPADRDADRAQPGHRVPLDLKSAPGREPVPGFDLTFSAPKSVSLTGRSAAIRSPARSGKPTAPRSSRLSPTWSARPAGRGGGTSDSCRRATAHFPLTSGFVSAPGWIRTSDRRIRSPMLYPAELRGLSRIVAPPAASCPDGPDTASRVPGRASGGIQWQFQLLVPVTTIL
jgi:hypothetical protein